MLKLTKQQKEIVAKYEPKEIYGKAKGSFYANKKECAYAFCGGKKNYDEELYALGKQAFMEAYEDMLKGAKKTTKTSRGNSAKKSTKKVTKTNKTELEDRVDALEDKLDMILELLQK